MELVWKTNPRGQLERKLNLAEREALLHVFSNGRKPAQAVTCSPLINTPRC